MPETTAGSTPQIERPSFNEIYEDMTGFDDEAVTKHLGYDVESLFDGLNDGSLKGVDRNNIVRACEFLRLRKEYTDRVPNPDAFAAQLVNEMPRRELVPIASAYWTATLAALAEDDGIPDLESPEGKDSPSSETSDEPNATDDPESTPPESETSD
jgi:hypothetical protein